MQHENTVMSYKYNTVRALYEDSKKENKKYTTKRSKQDHNLMQVYTDKASYF
jgi:hypothetical protein